MDKLRKSFTPRTKVLIFNNYQNPFGYSSSDEELKGINKLKIILTRSIVITHFTEIADLCVKHNLWVLSDEAYFDLCFGMSN
jgi:aspartate/methionine/tyrosine aminotransferase